VAKPVKEIVVSTDEIRLLAAGDIMVVTVLFVSLPYLLYGLLWLATGRGLPPKTAQQLEHARKMRRAERVWALQAVAMSAIAVAIYIVTMILLQLHHS
jgi:hypothetical protein